MGFIFSYPNTIRRQISSNRDNTSNCGVYKIPCKDCPKFYIGETGRDLSVRFKEHKKAVADLREDNGIASHVIDTGHTIDFVTSSLLYPCKDLKVRRVVESAIICTQRAHCLNQNTGFYPLDFHSSDLIVKSIYSNVLT